MNKESAGSCFRCKSQTSYIKKLGSWLCKDCWTDDIDFCANPKCVRQVGRTSHLCRGCIDAPMQSHDIRNLGANVTNSELSIKETNERLMLENANLRAEIARMEAEIKGVKAITPILAGTSKQRRIEEGMDKPGMPK